MSDTLSMDPRFSRAREDSLVPAMIIYGLYVVTLPTVGLSAVIGLILAYVLKGEAGPVAWSHYVFQIRTFWLHLLFFPLGLILLVVGIPLSFVVVGIPLVILGGLMLAGAHLWYVIRSLIGLVVAIGGGPYPRPRSWLA